jgi:hypothetical protein
MSVPLSAFNGVSIYNGTSTITGWAPQVSILSGAGGINLGYSPVSGYTLATPFTCSLVYEDIFTQAAITSSYTIIWWFGDGTYSTGFSPTHTYQWPGVYEIKVGIFNNNPGLLSVFNSSTNALENLDVNVSGTQYDILAKSANARTFSLTAVVTNFIQDQITWNYGASGYWGNTTWNDIIVGNPLSGACFHGYQSCKTGAMSSGPVPLVFNYYTTLLNNKDINFKFYAHDSLSEPYTQASTSQLVNLRPRWRFTTVSAGPLDDGAIISELGYTPVSSAEIRITPNGTLSATGTLVGLSGQVPFYYIDDIPSLTVTNRVGVVSASVNPTTLWVVLDTVNIPNYQDFEYSQVPSYSTSSVMLSSYFYVQTLLPEHFEMTVNGKVPFNDVYWPRVESRFVTTVASSAMSGTAEFVSNKNLLQFPLNTDTLYTLHTVYTLQNTTNPLSAVFNASTVPVDNNLYYSLSSITPNGIRTGGAYIGTFAPYTTASGLTGRLYTDIISGGLFYTTDLTPVSSTGFNPYLIPTSTFVAYYNTPLEGSSKLFSVPDFNTTYFARKFGGGFDYAAQLKASALQPTIAQNETLFNYYFPAVAGVSATNEDTFGGVAYEKITNFVANTVDPTVNNLNQFYSLTDSLGLQIDNYNYENIPGALKRIVDIYSSQQSYVWGARSNFARNFSLSAGLLNFSYPMREYNTYVATVSAGQKIVVNDRLYAPYTYEVLEVPAITSYASITARNLASYFPPQSAITFPLTQYPLSGFFGWGLQTPVQNYYRFFVYNPYSDQTQVEGLINWDDPLTTLSESASSHAEWVKDEGILETIYNYYLTKGLGLIN